METNHLHDDGSEDWERSLQQLRQTRHRSETAAEPVKPKRIVPGYYNREQNEAHQQVLRAYLAQWQQEHNAAVEQQTGGALTDEGDTTVLLQEDWLNAQNALQGEVDESAVLHSSTVWINPKHRPAASAESAAAPQQDTEDDDTWQAHIPVLVNVLNPKAVLADQPVMCLSERELIERLSKRLLPHLTDAVGGMVRTAIQRQAAGLTYQLQKSLAEETPSLVADILDYNLKATLAEIKYTLRTGKKDEAV